MNDDLAMIQSPTRWPCWPVLPLKRRNNSLEDGNLGVVLADGKALTIYHIYMFDPPQTPEEWKAAPQTSYATHEDMLKDGWIVD